MSLDLEAIEGKYLSDLLHQPEALQATWNDLRNASVFDAIASSCNADRFQRIVLTGMGSSYFGLHPLRIELAEHGWTPLLLETGELIHYFPHLLTQSSLVVAVSQSGKSVETVCMLELNARKATIIGVTNQADSPLAKQADFVVLTTAGEEFSVSCKTYISALLALRVLAAALCKLDTAHRLRDLEGAPAAAEGYLKNWRTHVEELGHLLHDARHLFLLGRGASMAAAGTGALIIKEADLFHAEGMSCAAFRHGPFEMLQPGIFVGVFAGEKRTRALNDGLVRDILSTGAQAVSFADDAPRLACRLPEVPDLVRAMVEILPVQTITLALAALANREPGKFARATKVTVVE